MLGRGNTRECSLYLWMSALVDSSNLNPQYDLNDLEIKVFIANCF
jgi:hypothetical protein